MAGNEATKAAVPTENVTYGKYAWAGGVLSGGKGRLATLGGATFGAPSGKEIRGHAMEDVIHSAGDNWNAVKAKYLADEDVMRQIVAYRKWFVDGLIDELRAGPKRPFRALKTRAAGSTALSSDASG